MIFSFTEDQLMVRDSIRKFAREKVVPSAQQWSEQHALPDALFDAMAEIGIWAADDDDADRFGEWFDAVTFAIVLEELARADASLALVVAVKALGAAAPVRVNADEPIDGLGMWAARVQLDGPGARDGHAWLCWNAAIAVGVARGALEEATAYAQAREQFGKPIAAYQAIQFKIAEMATAVDGARLLTLSAAAGEADGGAALRFAADAAVLATDEAVQIHGGYGYVREYPVERYYRDARWFPIWAGR